MPCHGATRATRPRAVAPPPLAAARALQSCASRLATCGPSRRAFFVFPPPPLAVDAVDDAEVDADAGGTRTPASCSSDAADSAAIVGKAAATAAALCADMPDTCASITAHVVCVVRLSRGRFLTTSPA